MNDLGEPENLLGMKTSTERETGTMRINQAEHIESVLERSNKKDSKPQNTPMAI